MPTLWYVLVAVMLAAYAVLDGFDLGAGALHLAAARTDEERRTLLRSIGPVWDGNEVWLIAAGGTLFFAFPLVYAVSFSGFYLPLNIVLWLLLLRAIGVEFRAQIDSPVWRDLFDGVFSLASALLAIFFGAALGNVIRGVPLAADHSFFAPLWTDWTPGRDAGILDWYTVLTAVFTLTSLALHGSLWVVYKTDGPLQARMRRIGAWLAPAAIALAAICLAASLAVRPALLDNYGRWPIGWLIPILVAGSLAAMLRWRAGGRDRAAFLASCGYHAGMLGGVAFALYPELLPATTGAANALTVHNASASPGSLATGLVWWIFGMALAIGYFVLVYRLFAGKVRSDGHY
jgi:cytochrome d ubiquinol oxidase subunit II